MVKSISVQDLHKMMQENEDFQLIDVREPHEYEEANIGGILIPLAQIVDRAEEIAKDKKVVVHCRSGKRSENAIKYLMHNYGYENIYNLEGGIMAYAAQIDSSKSVL